MPALAAMRFLERLARGKPVPAIVLLGNDLYLRDLCRAKLVEVYLPEGARAWGVARFSAAKDSLDLILNQAETLPMLAPRQVLFVRDAEALEKLGDDSGEKMLARFAAYLDNPATFTVLVLEASALDQRKRLFKMLREKALIVVTELGLEGEEREAAAVAMALQMASQLGIELLQEAAEELAEALNGELALIRSELEKLATYAGERRRIMRADVEALVISAKKYSVWELAEMLASQQRRRALEFLDSLLREGEPPAALVGAMAWMYRKLIQAREVPASQSGWQTARELGMRKETAEMAMKHSRKIPRERLLSGLAALYEADNRLKSGAVNDRAVMEFLVARLTAAPAPAGEAKD